MILRRLRAVCSGLLMVFIVFLSGALSAARLNGAAISLIRLGIRMSRGHHSLFYSELASIHERSGRLDEAVKCLNEAIQNEPHQATCAFFYFELGSIYEKKRQNDVALTNLERSLKLGTDFGEGFRTELQARIQRLKVAQ